MEVRLTASQHNGHAPEFAVAALEAAITGLESEAAEEEQVEAFVTVWNALARLGQREVAIGPDGEPVPVEFVAQQVGRRRHAVPRPSAAISSVRSRNFATP